MDIRLFSLKYDIEIDEVELGEVSTHKKISKNTGENQRGDQQFRKKVVFCIKTA